MQETKLSPAMRTRLDVRPRYNAKGIIADRLVADVLMRRWRKPDRPPCPDLKPTPKALRRLPYEKLGANVRRDLVPILARGDFSPQPLAWGTRRPDDGESWTHWAVYARRDVEAWGAHIGADGVHTAALSVCGWARSYSGPGRAFHSEPVAHASRSYVLVTQYGGLDI